MPRYAPAAAIGVVIVALPFWLSSGWLTTTVFVLIAATAVTGLNVLTGYTGQVSLGHAFFLAVGAYTAVLLADSGVPALIWIPGAGLVSALFGAAVGPIALRLSGLYLAVVTLGLVFLGQHVLFNSTWLSGGPQGRAFPSVTIGSLDFHTDTLALGPVIIESNGLYYYLAAGVLVVTTLYARNLIRTRPGRAMLAVRERPASAAVMGVNVARTKVSAFAVSSFLAGISGALYVSYVGFAAPAQWDVLLSIQYVAAIVIGGMGTVGGPLLGTAVVFALPSVLKSVPFFGEEGMGGVSPSLLAAMVYGSLIVVFLVAEPRGLVGLAQRVSRFRPRRRPRPVESLTRTSQQTRALALEEERS